MIVSKFLEFLEISVLLKILTTSEGTGLKDRQTLPFFMDVIKTLDWV